MNGLCCRCRQPGHVARDCCRAWGGSTSKPAHRRAPALRWPAGSSLPVPPPVADAPPPAAVPVLDLGASASVIAVESDMDIVPASVSDGHESPSEAVMCSGDEEVVAGAAEAASTTASSSHQSSPPWICLLSLHLSFC